VEVQQNYTSVAYRIRFLVGETDDIFVARSANCGDVENDTKAIENGDINYMSRSLTA